MMVIRQVPCGCWILQLLVLQLGGGGGGGGGGQTMEGRTEEAGTGAPKLVGCGI